MKCLSFSLFSKDKTKNDGYRTICKECTSLSDKLRRDSIPKENKEIKLSKNREYKKQNKDAINKNNRDWRRANPEKDKEIHNNWIENNSWKRAFYTSQRRNLIKKATPKWANFAYIKLFYEMAKMEENRLGIEVHVDHIVPIKGKNVCGFHVEDNLQLLFGKDNREKHNKFL